MKRPNFEFEKKLWGRGYRLVAGIDEVGRGCFAGPVVAAAVVFDRKIFKNPAFDTFGTSDPSDIFPKINDSKKLTALQREKSAEWIKENVLAYGIGKVSAKAINKIGMGKATQMAFRRAVATANTKLKTKNLGSIEFLLIDYFFVPYVRGLPMRHKKARKNKKLADSKARQLVIKNGDERSISIAAASIIAKVYRDKLMVTVGTRPRYKRYAWISNKGYATKVHREAILKHGITGYHRRQFVETYIKNTSTLEH